jgi:hypothetical protein
MHSDDDVLYMAGMYIYFSDLRIELDDKVHTPSLVVVGYGRVGANHVLALSILGLEADVLADREAEPDEGGAHGTATWLMSVSLDLPKARPSNQPLGLGWQIETQHDGVMVEQLLGPQPKWFELFGVKERSSPARPPEKELDSSYYNQAQDDSRESKLEE